MNSNLQIHIVFYLLITFSFQCLGQDRQIFFENLREQAGLPYHIVMGLDQDSLGRLWIPTYNGLYRYDGYQFKPYQHSPKDSNTISSNLCTAVLVDHQQRVWVGTRSNGLSIIHPYIGKVKRYPTLQTQDLTNQLEWRIEYIDKRSDCTYS